MTAAVASKARIAVNRSIYYYSFLSMKITMTYSSSTSPSGERTLVGLT
jgi:hypothetical protein